MNIVRINEANYITSYDNCNYCECICETKEGNFYKGRRQCVCNNNNHVNHEYESKEQFQD